MDKQRCTQQFADGYLMAVHDLIEHYNEEVGEALRQRFHATYLPSHPEVSR